MNYKAELENERQIGRFKNRIILGGFLLLLTMAWGWAQAPSDITLRYPPDLRSSAALKIGEVPPSEIYLFAQYILQYLNRWDKNGLTDYNQNISAMRYYLTPEYHQDLLEDYAARKKQGELHNRIRTFSPVSPYKESFVQVDGDAWLVWLDVNIVEYVLGEEIKNITLSYPIRVVRDSADFNKNPWQLALDGSGQYKPRKLVASADR